MPDYNAGFAWVRDFAGNFVRVATLEEEEARSGDGGVTNDAPANAIAVSDGENLTGSAALTWNETELGLVAAENSQAVIKAIGLGTQLKVQAGAGDATHVGGEVIILSGVSSGQNSGAMTLETGADSNGGDTGDLNIETGNTAAGTTGAVAIRTGDGADTGRILIQPGLAATGDAGGVDIQAGTATSGTDGWAALASADVSKQVYVDSTGIYLYGLPTTDPAVANQLWNDGGTLKVSAG